MLNAAGLRPWLAATAVLLLLDGLWLGVLARSFYQSEMGALMRPSIDWRPALLFYLAYPLGVIALARPLEQADWAGVIGHGAALGLLVYGVYDLTNLSTLAGWSWRLAVVDTGWGVVVTAAVAAAARLARPGG